MYKINSEENVRCCMRICEAQNEKKLMGLLCRVELCRIEKRAKTIWDRIVTLFHLGSKGENFIYIIYYCYSAL